MRGRRPDRSLARVRRRIDVHGATLDGTEPGARDRRSSGEPFSHWNAFVDYRLVADNTDGIWGTAGAPPVMVPQPTILTHVLLFRVERSRALLGKTRI